jgi:hypothetical protein
MDLIVPFYLRGHEGHVAVHVHSSQGAAESGAQLLDASLGADAGAGLPVCTATVSFSGAGYAAAMGWVQLVRSSDAENPDRYELDPLALFRGVNTPYAFFGISPTLFDAPFRQPRLDVTWQARSYLAVTSDAVITKQAVPIAGFTWGFRISGSIVAIEPPGQLDLRSWEDHIDLLEQERPGWHFRGISISRRRT